MYFLLNFTKRVNDVYGPFNVFLKSVTLVRKLKSSSSLLLAKPRALTFQRTSEHCYLRIFKSGEIRLQVEEDPFTSSLQSSTTNEKNEQYQVWKHSSEVDNLESKTIHIESIDQFRCINYRITTEFMEFILRRLVPRSIVFWLNFIISKLGYCFVSR